MWKIIIKNIKISIVLQISITLSNDFLRHFKQKPPPYYTALPLPSEPSPLPSPLLWGKILSGTIPSFWEHPNHQKPAGRGKGGSAWSIFNTKTFTHEMVNTSMFVCFRRTVYSLIFCFKDWCGSLYLPQSFYHQISNSVLFWRSRCTHSYIVVHHLWHSECLPN